MAHANDLSPRQQFETMVKPPVEAFLLAPECKWKARCAAHALTDLIEWTYYYMYIRSDDNSTHKKSRKDFRNEIIRECDAVRPVRDVADAARHRFLDRDDAIGATATSIFSHSTQGTTVQFNAIKSDYHQRNFSEIVKKVLGFWDDWNSRNIP
jgi:hypothetical protein